MNPTNDHQLIKVVLYTDNETRETLGVRTESVWASLTPEGNYTIENTPFYSLEVCTNDIVEVALNTDDQISQEITPTYTIARIIQPSGHATVHVHALAPRDRNLELEADPSYAPFADLHKFIESTEYTFEGNDCTQHYMTAIDIPPHTDPAPLFAKLDAGCQAAHWTYTHNHPTKNESA